MAETPDFSNLYNTPIPPSKQAAFEKWLKTKGRPSDYFDYDVQGFWLSGAGKDQRGHGSDQFKKPNHPTFSVESKYSTAQHPGGKWVTDQGGKTTFIADPSNFLYHSPDELQQYFKQVEPGIQLNVPPQAPGPAKPPIPQELQQKQQKAARQWQLLSNPIQSAQDLTKWVGNLISNPKSVPAESFFQSRITHTPGTTAAPGTLPKGAFGAYQPDVSPLERVAAASGYTPEQKAILARAFEPTGKGFMEMTPEGLGRADVMRHEQLHDVQAKSPAIQQHLLELAGRVNPKLEGSLKATPLYAKEIDQLGLIPVMAEEGSAIDLIPGLRNWLPDKPSPQLRDYYMKILADEPEHKRQVERLTDVSQLPTQKR